MVEEKKEKCMEQSEEQFNIQEILFRCLVHWPWFVFSVIVCIACAWGYLRLTTPVYNISATVLIKDDKKGGGTSVSSELERMGLDGFVSSSGNVDNEIEVLRSKSLSEEVVNNLGLFVTYMDEDELPKKELYQTSPVLVSLTPQEADKLPGRMEVAMTLQPTGVMDVQMKVGDKEYRKEFYGEGQLFYFYKRNGYTTFLHSPLSNMTESNYMFSWPDDETLFGKTN